MCIRDSPEGGAHHQAAYRQPDVLRHLSEICRCRHIFAVFDLSLIHISVSFAGSGK